MGLKVMPESLAADTTGKEGANTSRVPRRHMAIWEIYLIDKRVPIRRHRTGLASATVAVSPFFMAAPAGATPPGRGVTGETIMQTADRI